MRGMKLLRVSITFILLCTFFTANPQSASAIGSGNCVSTVNGATASVTQSGLNCIVIFTAGSGTWTLPAGTYNVSYLVVGGGGAASRGTCNVTYGPGGGGGGVQSGSLSLSGTVNVVVGAGGAVKETGCPNTSGASGSPSTLASVTAAGGGGSGVGKTGGTSGNGFAGGTDTVYTSCGECGAGGGGGASVAGSQLNGGAGVSSSLTGTSVMYGSGGAGRGGTVFGTASSGGGYAPSNCTATPNRGGGGADCNSSAGGGGSGIVVAVYAFNSAPVINGLNGAVTGSYSVNEGTQSLFNIDATDADAGSTLTYTLTGQDASNFTIGSTGTLAFTITTDYEAPVDSDSNNTYVVVTWVSDGQLNDSQTVTISIVNINEPSTISTVSLAGTPTKGIAIQATVNVNVAGKVRFYVNGKRVAGCLRVTTTGSYPSLTATCNWKPTINGRQSMSAQLTPSDNTFSATTSTPTTLFVLKRTTIR